MVQSTPLPERLRMVKLLRTHGLRHAERMRETELKSALNELGLHLDDNADTEQVALNPASSQALQGDALNAAAPPVEEDPAALEDRYDDAYALPFYREPKVSIPEGQRTFLRLIAVDWGLLFATWDLAPEMWQADIDGAELRILPVETENALDESAVLMRASVDLRARSWYLPVESMDRYALKAVLVTFKHGKAELLSHSNETSVPPTTLAPEGPLWFASISPDVPRESLQGGALVRALAGENVELPAGAEVDKSDKRVSPFHEPYEMVGSEAFPRRMQGPYPPELSGPVQFPTPWSGTFPSPWSGTLARSHETKAENAK